MLECLHFIGSMGNVPYFFLDCAKQSIILGYTPTQKKQQCGQVRIFYIKFLDAGSEPSFLD
jgi:hypothetical protein